MSLTSAQGALLLRHKTAWAVFDGDRLSSVHGTEETARAEASTANEDARALCLPANFTHGAISWFPAPDNLLSAMRACEEEINRHKTYDENQTSAA